MLEPRMPIFLAATAARNDGPTVRIVMRSLTGGPAIQHVIARSSTVQYRSAPRQSFMSACRTERAAHQSGTPTITAADGTRTNRIKRKAVSTWWMRVATHASASDLTLPCKVRYFVSRSFRWRNPLARPSTSALRAYAQDDKCERCARDDNAAARSVASLVLRLRERFALATLRMTRLTLRRRRPHSSSDLASL